MDTKTLKIRTLQAVLVIAGLAIAQGPAYSQQASAVTVVAPQITRGFQPIGRFGASVPVVSASAPVSYAGLDLATYSGATTLEARVRDAAGRLCKQLVVAEPTSVEGDPPCVKQALRVGMLHARAAIAAAEAQARVRTETRERVAAVDVGRER